MLDQQTNTFFELRPIKEIENYNFFVDDYQRGYKWTSLQVHDLLNDIDEFDKKQGIYCLQPVVAKERSSAEEIINEIFGHREKIYELIDGQQRMTTIYMILAAINGTNDLFSIAYCTRPESKNFLSNISNLPICVLDIELLKDSNKLEEAINLHWEKYIKSSDNIHFNNVDNYHFFMAYQVIHLWFSGKSSDLKKVFKDKILDYTNIIWYQVDKEDNSKKVFRNINSGKIQLTNAELIKALFLISCKDEINKELTDYKQNEIALEWDRIENALQNDEFWYFINKDPEKEEKATRIDFLFDVIKKKRLNEKDDYYSYRKYAEDFKLNHNLNWLEVKNHFERLLEWFEDRTLYHYIGFIISQGFSDIPTVLKLSENKGKKSFETAIVDIVRERFKIQKDNKPIYHLDNLHYKDAYAETRTVLLLLNIETYQKSDANFRFPFNRYKKENWTIEHIHAQNASLFTTNKELIDWSKDMLTLIEDIQRTIDKTDLKKVDTLKENLKHFDQEYIEEDISKGNKDLLKDISEELSLFLDMNLISNLALLDGNTNSSIGNKKFLDKRVEILKIDKLGWAEVKGEKRKAFIPICTKNAFLKYYTKKIDQMTYWGYQDRIDYKSAIEIQLNKYYQ